MASPAALAASLAVEGEEHAPAGLAERHEHQLGQVGRVVDRQRLDPAALDRVADRSAGKLSLQWRGPLGVAAPYGPPSPYCSKRCTGGRRSAAGRSAAAPGADVGADRESSSGPPPRRRGRRRSGSRGTWRTAPPPRRAPAGLRASALAQAVVRQLGAIGLAVEEQAGRAVDGGIGDAGRAVLGGVNLDLAVGIRGHMASGPSRLARVYRRSGNRMGD